MRKLLERVRDWLAAHPWVASVGLIVLIAVLLVVESCQLQTEAKGLGLTPTPGGVMGGTPSPNAPMDPRAFLPFITAGGHMSYWKLIKPEATTNLVLNPSGEGDTEFSAHGGGVTVTAVTTDAKYGRRSYRIQTTNDHDGINLTVVELANAIHYISFALRTTDTIPTNGIEVSADNAAWHQAELLMVLDADWSLYGAQIPAAQCNGSVDLYIAQDTSTGSGDFRIDAVQCEQKEYWTTYCDGEQEGCEWGLVADEGPSTRSAIGRAGGRIRDLETDYYFDVSGYIGPSLPLVGIRMESYTQHPGAVVTNVRDQASMVTLLGTVRGTDWEDIHAKKQALQAELSREAYPGDQPVRLIYTGAATVKTIKLVYEGGLEGTHRADRDPCYWERASIRFLAADPYWREQGNSAAMLETEAGVTLRTVAARVDGVWTDMGAPDNAGTYDFVYVITRGPDGYIYLGGSFENFDNIDEADNIVRYNPATQEYSALANGLNGDVYCMAWGPDGTLYVGGLFTDAGTDTDADNVAQWNGTAFSAIGGVASTPTAVTNVYSIMVERELGDIWVGGDFSDFAGKADCNFIAVFDVSGGDWGVAPPVTAEGEPSHYVRKIFQASDENIYIGGRFGSWGDANGNAIVRWDPNGPAMHSMDEGLAGAGGGGLACFDIAENYIGRIFVSGNFTQVHGVWCNGIAMWNGTVFERLGEGLSTAYGLNVIPEPTGPGVWVVGQFAYGGELAVDGIARWNGYAWGSTDIEFLGAMIVYDLLITAVDPVLSNNYDMYIAPYEDGAGTLVAGETTVTNDGTKPAYPVIYIHRSGGTYVRIQTIRNETDGRGLLLDYELDDGETLVINLSPHARTVWSDYWGPQENAMQPNCDYGSWRLVPGTNQVMTFVYDLGSAATITAWMEWKDTYGGMD